MFKSIYTIFFHLFVRRFASAENVVVNTTAGSIVGKRNFEAQSFLGIRYGKPPVHERRWRAPEPADHWDIVEAFNFGPECMQSSSLSNALGKNMSEDCLYLNIWTPSNASFGDLYPVMVWIYGGGFQQGASGHSIYRGNMLARRDVIIVSMNYRVGALGFLVSVRDGLWGNYGLQDQRLALQWIQDHILNFGGNPADVTLFGESAGAMSVGLHMHMDCAGTLFHKVIMQSNPLGYKFRSVTVANFLGQAVKIGLDCTDLQCMRHEPATEIIRQQEMLLGVPRSVGDFFTWGPVTTDKRHLSLFRSFSRTIQGNVPLMNITQPLTMWQSVDEGRLEVPVLMGINAHEGQMFVHGAFPVPMPKYVYWGFVMALFRQSAPKVLQQYGNLSNQCQVSGDYREVMSQIIHDYLFRCPLWHTAHVLQNRRSSIGGTSSAPVFVYEFSHPTKVPDFSVCIGLACHTAELPYVFEQHEEIQKFYSFYGSQLENKIDSTSSTKRISDSDLKVSEIMAEYWTNFAKSGNPNSMSRDVEWPEWNAKEKDIPEKISCPNHNPPVYLEINETPQVNEAKHDCICQFWDKLQWRY